MAIPQVKIKNISHNLETDYFYGFIFNNDWGWSRYIFKKHPDLKKVLDFKKENERVKFISNYVNDYNKKNSKKIIKSKDKIQKIWEKIEKDYFLLLEEILNAEWPKKRKNITALISINPICPRILEDWSFFINYNFKPKDILEVIMHETCHFLYFKKWKELFPNTKPKQYDSPFIEWHLSELVAPIILNDERVQKFLKQKAVFYEEHQKIKIENFSVPVYFSRLYNRFKKQGKSFDDFTKQAYIDIKKHRRLFK